MLSYCLRTVFILDVFNLTAKQCETKECTGYLLTGTSNIAIILALVINGCILLNTH